MRVAASDDKHERCHCFESHGELAETRKIAKNLERKEKLALEAKWLEMDREPDKRAFKLQEQSIQLQSEMLRFFHQQQPK